MTAQTPMMRQYRAIKKDHPEAILFFRLGDFYEMFFEDAREASRLLDITLTSRESGKGNRVPMCGIPYHAAEGYIAKILGAGRKVAICEQVENPAAAKGLVRREVTRVITPGTVMSGQVLADRRNNFLAGVVVTPGICGLAILDVSAGDFRISETEDPVQMTQELLAVAPSEILIPELSDEPSPGWITDLRSGLPSAMISEREPWLFEKDACRRVLLEQYHVQSLDGFGLDGFSAGITAGGALLEYVKETVGDQAGHLRPPVPVVVSDHMVLDPATRRNLELTEPMRGTKRSGTLLSVLDETITTMGARLLGQWVLHPLLDGGRIEERLDAVEGFFERPDCLTGVRDALGDVRDMERILGRVSCGYGNARDLVALKGSLQAVPGLKASLKDLSSCMIDGLRQDLDPLEDLVAEVDAAVNDSPPITVREGGMIREGFDAQLDELRTIASSGKNWIAALQKKEADRTGIKTLKIGYNKVFGYYLEVSKANLARVPEDFIRKQTLVNAERFITAELKDQESRVLGAQERIKDVEYRIFCDLRERVVRFAQAIQRIARAVATLDVLANLAHVAQRRDYTRPHVEEDDVIEIRGGRHPVLETLLDGERFVPNDTLLDTAENQVLVLTGPNMAGKSTYIRQVALLVLMAQMGAFIPAERARIGLTDRIFTRVGASDELARGQSTFMVEMCETANILNNATAKSLIVLDEIGRGTSTFDGISIAWAVAEFLHNTHWVKARTLFATHYHELTDLALTLPGVKNFNVAVREWNDRIMFLRRIVAGGTDKSYGIHVARLAGIPEEVIERAKDILNCLEEGTIPENEIGTVPPPAVRTSKVEIAEPKQLPLFEMSKSSLADEIRRIRLENMTPLDALNKLQELQVRIAADDPHTDSS